MATAGYQHGYQGQNNRGHHGGGTQLGGGAFNHKSTAGSEEEYDRLRNLARQEHSKMSSCFDRAHAAHSSGNGGEAHQLSEEGKRHQAAAAQYNKQASEYIFRENNAMDRVAGDTIDLHGQFVEEAEDILEERIRAGKARGETHLHVIVGKGNHSPGHIQKIKPRVEQVCREQGLQYSTEENAGRIYINLQGGQAQMPPPSTWGQSYNQGGHYGGGGGGYPGQAPNMSYTGHPQQQFDQQQEQKQDPITACIKSCCTVM